MRPERPTILTVREQRAADRSETKNAQVPHASPQGESTIMNLLTDILAGLVHFVGWLV
jgi:hypothetical protein